MSHYLKTVYIILLTSFWSYGMCSATLVYMVSHEQLFTTQGVFIDIEGSFDCTSFGSILAADNFLLLGLLFSHRSTIKHLTIMDNAQDALINRRNSAACVERLLQLRKAILEADTEVNINIMEIGVGKLLCFAKVRGIKI